MTSFKDSRPFRIRTITAFVNLHPDDFVVIDEVVLVDDAGNSKTTEKLLGGGGVHAKVRKCACALRGLEAELTKVGYEVQTLRIATNPFGEWLTITPPLPPTTTTTATDDDDVVDDNDDREMIRRRLRHLDGLLSEYDVSFCSLGPSMNIIHTTQICPVIVSSSFRFSCSANVDSRDVHAARAASECIMRISALDDDMGDHVRGGLGNFRFCASSHIGTVPFFPGARSPPTLLLPAPRIHDENDQNGGGDDRRELTMTMGFAIGLENGGFACALLEEARTIREIKRVFDGRMRDELLTIQEVCTSFVGHRSNRLRRCDDGNNDDYDDVDIRYMGIDTSLNPSLDDGGSVARAIERLEEVRGTFGRAGTMAAASAITTSLQSIPDVLITGYCGLMLPVLEDRRLAELAGMSSGGTDGDVVGTGIRLTIDRILCMSSVCGVGVDTVPIPGNINADDLTSLILDVAALAGRWNKPLSCRVFPVHGKVAGEMTTFDSPYMCNSRIFDL
jgi:hypothetical protein